ncbi:MAG: LysR substrate-binding domain-containing protein [Mitsuokella sp.]|uniref:LysR family transcriptional regulator n=1 Tax=Mitsuokella sp. TaxID=2049034 RepID=UPI003D7C53FE
MFELSQLEQLLAFARYGTLSAAAEHLHLSQPALSRSMRRLEEDLSVPLFTHAKNKIAFNENGELAVKYAEQIVREACEMKTNLLAAERARHTIFVGSCAPAPLWTLLPHLSALYPDMTITSEIRGLDTLKEKLLDKTYQLIVLPYPIEEAGFSCQEIGEEHLCFTLPPAHPLAHKTSLHLADLNGETMLLRPNLGFWFDLVKKAMPDTNFLIQDENAFDELVRFSVLPTFVTDLSLQRIGAPEGRVVIPIEDEAVNIHYYCCYEKNTLPKLTKLLHDGNK